MAIFDLSKFECLKEPERLSRLNAYLEVNASLMPHSVAVATGCSLEDVLALLLALYSETLVEGHVLMYHSAHLDFPFRRRSLREGLPRRGSFYCPVCEIDDIPDDDLYFDLEFVAAEAIRFTVNP